MDPSAAFPVFRAVRIRRSAMGPLDPFPVFWTAHPQEHRGPHGPVPVVWTAHPQEHRGPLGPVPVVWTAHRCTVRPHWSQQYRHGRSAHSTFLVRPTVPFPRVSRALELKIVLGVNEHHPAKTWGLKRASRPSYYCKPGGVGGREGSVRQALLTLTPPPHKKARVTLRVQQSGPWGLWHITIRQGTRTTNWILNMKAFNSLIIWSTCFQSDTVSPKWFLYLEENTSKYLSHYVKIFSANCQTKHGNATIFKWVI